MHQIPGPGILKRSDRNPAKNHDDSAARVITRLNNPNKDHQNIDPSGRTARIEKKFFACEGRNFPFYGGGRRNPPIRRRNFLAMIIKRNNKIVL
jgi:hypothetical protein